MMILYIATGFFQIVDGNMDYKTNQSIMQGRHRPKIFLHHTAHDKIFARRTKRQSSCMLNTPVLPMPNQVIRFLELVDYAAPAEWKTVLVKPCLAGRPQCLPLWDNEAPCAGVGLK